MAILRNSGWKAALAIYLLFFMLLFLQFPLSGSLPGKVDNWGYLVMFRTIHNNLFELFAGVEAGRAFYPEIGIYPFGNYSFAQAIVFILYKWTGLSDLNAYYLFLSTLFALNALAVYLLATQFIRTWIARFCAGLIFASTNFMFGNMDNPDSLFLSVGIAAVYFLIRAFAEERPEFIPFAGILAAFEVYFSSYGFLFTVILMATTIAYYHKSLGNAATWRWAIPAVMIFIAFITPYCMIYVFDSEMSRAYNPARDMDAVSAASLHWADLLKPLKYNLFYSYRGGEDYNWIYKTRSAFTGILLPVTGLAGMWFHRKRGWFLLGMSVCFFLALGPYLGVDGVRSPLYYLYDNFNIQGMFRISVRAYLFCTMIMAIAALALVERLATGKKRYALLVITAAACMLLENVPYCFEKYPSARLMQESLEGPLPAANSKVLNLPSSFYSGHIPGFDPLCEKTEDYEFEFIREYLYMYRQTYDRSNILNGFAGFIPATRMRNQRWILDIGSNGYLDSLIQYNDLDYVVWNGKFNNGCDLTELQDFLAEAPQLEMFERSDSIVIYSCRAESP